MKAWISFVLFTMLTSFYGFSQWQQLNGPYGGIISYLTAGNSKVVAELEGLGTGSGAYISLDHGDNWVSMKESLSNMGIIGVQEVGLNDSAIFLVSSGNGHVIIRSFDNGLNWTTITSGLPQYTFIQDLFVSDNHLLIQSDYGVFHSPDQGDTWIEANNGLSYYWIVQFCESDSSIYGITQEGIIFQTTNYGVEWIEINSHCFQFNKYIRDFFLADSVFYLAAEGGVLTLTLGDTVWISMFIHSQEMTRFFTMRILTTRTEDFTGLLITGIHGLRLGMGFHQRNGPSVL